MQRSYEAFRVKTPIYDITDDKILARVGMKEGVTLSSKFEVLEKQQDNKGRIRYRRVGTIRPEIDKIWDNRYMAAEEKAKGSELNYTEFRKISGTDFYPGMLIRQIK